MAFQETQKMDALWIKVLIIFNSVLTLVIVGKEMIEQPDTTLIATFISLLVFMVALYFFVVESKATTRIDTQGIHYKYPPFIMNWKLVGWTDIERVEIKSVSPLTDFGGWGYRFNRKGKGIILSGDKAIIAYLKSGKKFTITTKAPEAAQREIDRNSTEKIE